MLTMVADDGAWAMILPSMPSPLYAGNIIVPTAYRIVYRVARCTVTEDQTYEENTRSKFTENVNRVPMFSRTHARMFYFSFLSLLFLLLLLSLSLSLFLLLCLVFFLSYRRTR